MKKALRNIGVLMLAAYALLSVVAAASYLWAPGGTIGLNPGYGAEVRSVDPDSPAARAGIVAGDRIDLRALNFEQRRYFSGMALTVPVGETLHFRVFHNGVGREVTLRAIQAEFARADRISLILECIATLFFVVIGGVLILLRPSVATWGFGFYCMVVNPTAPYPFRFDSPYAAFFSVSFFDVVQNLGVVGLLVFALNFPRRLERSWRPGLERLLPLLFVVLAAMTWYPDAANMLLGIGARTENRILQVAFGLVWAAAIFILWDTYERGPVGDRARLRWVLVGFAVGLATNYVGNTIYYSTLLPVKMPDWVVNVLVSLNVLLPLAVAHAVVRHRVLDINFVISRTLVYAVFTAVLVGVFGFLDWLFARFLADFRLSVLVEAMLTIAAGYGFKAVETQTERAIDNIFFHTRRLAEERLERLTKALPHAKSEKLVDNVLTLEGPDALRLVSAAVFRDLGKGAFTRVSSRGWTSGTRETLGEDDLLVLALRAGASSVKLNDLPWNPPDVPAGSLAPIVGVSVGALGALRAIVLYGAHPNGQDVDPGELTYLEALAGAAATAYDEIEAQALRDENRKRQAEIADLRARLDEYRSHRLEPAPDGGPSVPR